MLDAATFRLYLPEFADVTKFPDSAVNFWIGAATIMLPVQTWGAGSVAPVSPPTTMLDIGAALFVAHNLVLEAQNARIVIAGGIPGMGSLSISYDLNIGLIEGGGPWNLTTYGTRFLFMARLAGKGPIQLGVDRGYGIQPWFGPPVGPNGYW